jgi:hypothetical protein
MINGAHDPVGKTLRDQLASFSPPAGLIDGDDQQSRRDRDPAHCLTAAPSLSGGRVEAVYFDDD